MNEAQGYGMVGINGGIISIEMAPFAGVKESAHGREGSNTACVIMWSKSICV